MMSVKCGTNSLYYPTDLVIALTDGENHNISDTIVMINLNCFIIFAAITMLP